MSPSGRKLLLTTHITVSVGWVGAIVAYLAVVAAGMATLRDPLLRAAWIGLELIGWYVLVPLALAALVSGIAIALLTPWGLFQHYWVSVSLVLTSLAAGVLIQHMGTVSEFAGLAADPATVDVRSILGPPLRGELLHAGIGLLILLAVEALNVFKPRGLSAYGRRKSAVVSAPRQHTVPGMSTPSRSRTPGWVHAVWIHAAVLVLVFAIMHLTGRGLRLHD